jgi:RNA polymerase sigma factor (sigma-70 family)
VTAMADRRRSAPGSGTSDPELLTRIVKGETSAIGLLFDRYDGDVRRVVSRLGVPAADVDDVVQATFLDVLRAAAGYDGRDDARPWLIGLAVVQVRRHRRSLARIAARITAWAREPSPRSVTPEEEAARSQAAARARRALDALPAKKREVIVLVTIEGLSGEEAAKVLGIPVATVWTRLHHARREIMAAVFEEES